MQERWVWFLSLEGPLEKETATYSNILAGKNPMDRKAWWVTVHEFQRGGHDWARARAHAHTHTHTHTLHAYILHLDTLTNIVKSMYMNLFILPTYDTWSSFCKVICSKKETPSVGVDPHVKPSRMLERRCSQVALFLCHTGNSTYSNVFIQCIYKNVFPCFSVFSRKCHKFLKNQLKTQFNHWYLSAFISVSHVPVIFMRC